MTPPIKEEKKKKKRITEMATTNDQCNAALSAIHLLLYLTACMCILFCFCILILALYPLHFFFYFHYENYHNKCDDPLQLLQRLKAERSVTAHSVNDILNIVCILPIENMMTQLHFAGMRNRNEAANLNSIIKEE